MLGEILPSTRATQDDSSLMPRASMHDSRWKIDKCRFVPNADFSSVAYMLVSDNNGPLADAFEGTLDTKIS